MSGSTFDYKPKDVQAETKRVVFNARNALYVGLALGALNVLTGAVGFVEAGSEYGANGRSAAEAIANKAGFLEGILLYDNGAELAVSIGDYLREQGVTEALDVPQ